MNLSSTTRAGRRGWHQSTSDEEEEFEVVGSVILHDKRQFWGKANTHYHNNMKAGQNTLNAHCARVLIRSIAAGGVVDAKGELVSPNQSEAHKGRYDRDSWLKSYVLFLTTPGSHNDTYAEGYHRDFFSNYHRLLKKAQSPDQVDLTRCAGDEGHDTASIGGLVTLPPLIIAQLVAELKKIPADARRESLTPQKIDEVSKLIADVVVQHQQLTHKSKSLSSYVRVYSHVLTHTLLEAYLHSGSAVAEAPLKRSIQTKAAPSLRVDFGSLVSGANGDTLRKKIQQDRSVVGGRFGMACYISDSLPSLLYLSYRYANDFESAVISNTNCGGENCHRGATLGALVGANVGVSNIPG